MASDTITSEHTLVALLPALQACVASQDRECFRHRVETIDWSTHTPEEMLAVVQMALDMDDLVLAKELIQQAATLFPDHDKTRAWLRILAPPYVRYSFRPASENSHHAENGADLIDTYAKMYQGQWVAVRNDTFLGAFSSYEELYTNLKQGSGTDNVIFTRMP